MTEAKGPPNTEDSGTERRIVIVANPTSGRGRSKKIASHLVRRINEAGMDARLAVTTRKGHAELLAKEAIDEGASTVVACGGDGTINEVANAIVGTSATMGIAPAGRCNDFARALHINRDEDKIADIIINRPAHPIDLGRINQRYFCTVAAAGFDARVAAFVDKMIMPLKGTPAYIYGVLRVLLRFKPTVLHLTGDFGSMEGPMFLVAACNTESYGGAMKIAPGADPADGLLNICIVSPLSKTRLVRFLPKVLTGDHISLPEVRVVKSKTLTMTAIRPAGPYDIWADGEPIDAPPLTVESVPAAVRIHLPQMAVP
jgi:diacylglycerol kinase (ATP)